MIKSLFLKIYGLAYALERFALKRGIYNEGDLYDVRFDYGYKKERKINNAKR